ncbi:hypothetical protein CONPUDRAFT_157705 [Coniophora puteana RWD-64-598 SS2]|uniref:Uncharacterized protein n=1 Tax=Coniophora puteana (strain RWD-64-598) TaxID=741705 RepID=A0A5M3MEL8_CONPW|nr:uncharacterized protein CONPUDRAFT_157705 [Coniophora puteana RWD-64-598 SS2]EIW77456.1 hypothetical protein CONPUDRAFT_157705 [Coniophora puteana RWD-64-598 SS2]
MAPSRITTSSTVASSARAAGMFQHLLWPASLRFSPTLSHNLRHLPHFRHHHCQHQHHHPTPPPPFTPPPFFPPSSSPPRFLSPIVFSATENHDESHKDNRTPPSSPREEDTSAADVDHAIGEQVDMGPLQRLFHKYLTARKCSPDGDSLPPDAPPSPPPSRPKGDWFPFRNQLEFETADLCYRRVQMSATHIDALCKIWAASLAEHNAPPLCVDHTKMYEAIDGIENGDVAWQSFHVTYQGPRPERAIPSWMEASYDVWFRDPREILKNILGRPDLKDDIDLTPYRDYDSTGIRQYGNLFSGDWAWDQATRIANDVHTHGATFVPFVLGSDKTTVSVATGQSEYYPLYISPGNIHNSTRRAHCNAVALVGFLSVPKTDETCSDDPHFRHFRRQLYHTSISTILQVFKPGMTCPEVIRFGDGYHRRVIWGVGPYIADYPEQVLLAGVVQGWCPRCLARPQQLDGGALRRCREHTEALVEELHPGTLWDTYGIISNVVPFTNDFPRADIHELIAPDILHQLIKGTFKDHLVDWVTKYLKASYPKREYKKILADIDRRIAIAAPFAGLRRFPQGRGFKQWTGDDSKALMKVYLPAIENHLPDDMVRAVRAFLEFCYIVRRNTLTDTDITELERALAEFHHHRTIFEESGVAASLSLPRQHSLVHYIHLIRQYGAPNGLCSSITESKHIEAVKEPWRRSSRFDALGQMLVTNQRLDKLKAIRIDFAARGMLNPIFLPAPLRALQDLTEGNHFQEPPPAPENALQFHEPRSRSVEECEDEPQIDGTTLMAEVNLAAKSNPARSRTFQDLADEINVPNIRRLTRRFLYSQLHPNVTLRTARSVPPQDLPNIPDKLRVYDSAVSVFRAPSDLCGSSGLRRERIRSTPVWRGEAARYDTAFIMTQPDVAGIFSMEVARVLAFFSFKHQDIVHPCVVVHWYNWYGDARDDKTGMYMVRPSFNSTGSKHVEVLHVDSLVRAAHLLPFFGEQLVPKEMTCHQSLDSFELFYVNRYADHHAFEIA